MRARAATVALVGACIGAAPVAAQAHTSFFAGGGVSFPAGEFASYANNGWTLLAGVERSLGDHPFALRVGFTYAVNNDSTAIGFHESTKLASAMGAVVYHFTGALPHLYLLAGGGWLNHRFSSDDPDEIGINESKFMIQLGEGVNVRIRGAQLFIEGRFVTELGPEPLRFFPIVLGVRFGSVRP